MEAVCVLSLMVSITCRVDWTKTTCADLLGRYFTSVHVRPSVCVVYFILRGMYKVLHLSLGRRPECWLICGLWVCFLPSWLKLELLDTSLLYLKGHFKSGKPLHFIERVNSPVWGNFP